MKEIRKLDMQFRAEDTEDGKMETKGYAVVFNSPETYGYTETISSSALDETDMSDVVLRYNHNDSFMVLARTRNKSLKLEKDDKGLTSVTITAYQRIDGKEIPSYIIKYSIEKVFLVEEKKK